MKKLLTLLLAMATIVTYSQITFENYYPTGGVPNKYLRLVKLSASGYKYVINDKANITLYNLNHTLFRNITIPTLPINAYSSVNIYYLSEELFNTNPADIEYFLMYNDSNGISHSKVINEFGSILLTQDSTSMMLSAQYGNEEFICYTPSGVKMIIGQRIGASVYSLPGTLPCHDCTNGITTSIMVNNNGTNTGEISNYPNPTAEQTTIEYTLPHGSLTADLVFYTIAGKEVKRFTVTNAFHNIIITTADLEAGTYYYQLQTADGFKVGKKMVVVK